MTDTAPVPGIRKPVVRALAFADLLSRLRSIELTRRMIGVLLIAGVASSASGAVQNVSLLLELSIEELANVEVTTVSRRAEPLSEAAASVYVITGDQIQRAGITTLPEALRLAPGVEVARNSAHTWTISMRGFSSDLSNKLLVLIDGRSVYSPLYAGVYWDAQDTLLKDIDRIEVIAGPGGTMWGANAVNGVINIITRSAWETDGGVLQVGVGQQPKVHGAARIGGRLGEDIAARAYVKRIDRASTRRAIGGRTHDDWEFQQTGFRAEWVAAADQAVTIQGDAYSGDLSAMLRPEFTLGTLPGDNVPGTVDIAGYNVLGRWQRVPAAGSEIRLQAYVDYTRRDIPGSFSERRHTADLDFSHLLQRTGRHQIMWGAGFRVTRDDIGNTQFATFDPPKRTDRTYSIFLQDRIELMRDRLFLTVGSKLERNEYSGFEHQPSARLLWTIDARRSLWAAVSRAVRIPARLNHDLELHAPLALPGLPVPFYVNVRGTDDFRAEELVASELGYRWRWRDDVSFDVTLYHHAYDKLLTNEVQGPPVSVPGPPGYLILPIELGNGLRGDTYGGTASVRWQPAPSLRLDLQYSHIEFDLTNRPGSIDQNAANVAGNSPKHQAAVHAYWHALPAVNVYAGVRYVDELTNQNVRRYVAVDASADWQLTPRLKGSLTLRNLTDGTHAEFGSGNEIPRSAFVRFDLAF